MPYTYADYYNGRDPRGGSQLGRGMMPPQIEMLLRNAGLYSDAYQRPAGRTRGTGYMPAVLRAAGRYGQSFRAAGGGAATAPPNGLGFQNQFDQINQLAQGLNQPAAVQPSAMPPRVSYATRSQEIGDVMQRPAGRPAPNRKFGSYRPTRPRIF